MKKKTKKRFGMDAYLRALYAQDRASDLRELINKPFVYIGPRGPNGETIFEPWGDDPDKT